MTANDVLIDLKKVSNPKRAESAKWFFKTAKGEYGEGDKFLGVSVPNTRKITKKYKSISISEIIKLLKNPYHEARLAAVILLVQEFQYGDEKQKRLVYEAYINNTNYVNNWDIVDSSAHKIVGPYLSSRPEKMIVLRKLAISKNMWERRISMVSTAYNIAKLHSSEEALEIAQILLKDKEDLIQKAVGWMLREVGKYIDENILKEFLDKYAQNMPRTMLRYSIERLSEPERKHYLRLKQV